MACLFRKNCHPWHSGGPPISALRAQRGLGDSNIRAATPADVSPVATQGGAGREQVSAARSSHHTPGLALPRPQAELSHMDLVLAADS